MGNSDLSDLLGNLGGVMKSKDDSLDDLLGPPPKKRNRRKPAAPQKHAKMVKPAKPLEDGIFALRAKAQKAGTLGKKCLIDGVNLKKSRNGQRVICEKYECFRAYRNAYRAEYDRKAAT